MNAVTPKSAFGRGIMFSRKWVSALGGAYWNWQDRIERELHVKQRARDNGRNNLPAATDAEPDVVQQHIIDRFGTGLDSLKQALWNRLKGAHDLIAQRIPQKLEPQAIADAAELAIKRERDRARNPLIGLRKQERDRWRDYCRFRSENQLTGRSASYPQPWPPVKLAFWIVFALVIESLFNGMIFAQANANGLEGGVVQAVAFSAVNIVLGFVFLGFIAARYAGHAMIWKRIAGIAGVVLAITSGVIFNLFVAHYREIIERIPLDQIDALSRTSYVDAATHMREHPFDFTTWQAIVLFVIGLAIFIVLAAKGYHADDTYPRYGHHDRAYKKALRAYEDAQAKVKKSVEVVIDNAAGDLKRRLVHEAYAVEESRDILAESEQAERETADSAADLARACTVNLRNYRETNSYVRTLPPPAYFKEYPEFAIDLPELPLIKARFQDALDGLERNRIAANEIERHLNEVSRAELDAFLAYVEDIEQEATRRVEDEQLPKAA